MILAIYNDETIIAFGENMQDVIDTLQHIDDYNKAEEINRYITFYDADKLNTVARDMGVVIDVIPTI